MLNGTEGTAIQPRKLKSTLANLWNGILVLSSVVVAGGCSKASRESILRRGTPAEAAAKAMELHDSNKDGKLDKQELAAASSLTGSLRYIDANRNGAIELAELQGRFEAHDAMPDLASFDVQITANRAPLAGAEVTFTAEPFMGEGKQPYVGTTADNGMCGLRGQVANVDGVPIGFYQVRIVHTASGVEVTRGCEVATDLPTANRMIFDTELATIADGDTGR
jgi:hypothetical protein